MVPSRPVPIDCKVTPLDTATACGSAANCPVRFAGKLDCSAPGQVSVQATTDALYVGLFGGVPGPAPSAQWVAKVDVGQSAVAITELDSIVQPWLMLDGDGTPLIALPEETKLRVRHLGFAGDAGAAEQDVAVIGTPIDALFDRAGNLHVFSFVKPADFSTPWAYYHSPGSGAPAFSAFVNSGKALLLTDGTPAFAYAEQAGTNERLGLWTEKTGAVVLVDFPPGVVVADMRPPQSFAPSLAPLGAAASAGTSRIVASHASGTSVSLWDGMLRPLASWPQSTGGCSGHQTVPPPDYCMMTTRQVTIGDGPWAHGLASGASGVPWLFTGEGSLEGTCAWRPRGGCVEWMTCDCNEELDEITFGGLTVHAEAIGGTRAFDIHVEDAKLEAPVLALAPRSDGIVVVAVSWYTPYDPLPARTHVRFFGVDTR